MKNSVKIQVLGERADDSFVVFCQSLLYNVKIPGAKAINHRVLAHKWFYGLMTRPDMRIKVGRKLHDIRILGWIVGAHRAEQSRWHLLALLSRNEIRQETQENYIIKKEQSM